MWRMRCWLPASRAKSRCRPIPGCARLRPLPGLAALGADVRAGPCLPHNAEKRRKWLPSASNWCNSFSVQPATSAQKQDTSLTSRSTGATSTPGRAAPSRGEGDSTSSVAR
eukprot:scaffold15336_cov114-Isochrysis_galbana.AAC.2